MNTLYENNASFVSVTEPPELPPVQNVTLCQ